VRIHSVQCIGVEGVRDGEYAFTDATGRPADVVVVAGPVASGKTRLLELLLLIRNVLAPTNDEADEDSWVRLGGRSARVLVNFWLDENERATVGHAEPIVATETILSPDPELVGEVEPDAGLCFLLDRYDHSDQSSKFEYFAESRRLDVGGGSMSLSEETQKKFRTSKDPRKFSFIPDFLSSLKLDQEAARRFEQSLASFSASCRLSGKGGQLSSSGRTVSSLDELSSSERDAVMFSAVASLVRLSQSVIFVDRPDLYIREQHRALAGLSSFGVSNQLFVTSYAPDLFASVESRCVISL
jgi:hypothetical protein